MTQLLQIAQLGAPVLRKVAKPVINIHERRIQMLIKDLLSTMNDSDGVGIAAPQVYKSYRIIIIASHPNNRYPDAPEMEPVVMINPSITSHSQTQVKGWEGCLSVPEIRGFIPRYRTITVSYADQFGNKKEQAFREFVARIVQHEIDHLDGKLFVDQVESSKDLISEKEYLKKFR